jgi:hypothetical protein
LLAPATASSGIEFRDGGLNLRDADGIEAPGLAHVDSLVEIPEDTLLAWPSYQGPCDDSPAKLLVQGEAVAVEAEGHSALLHSPRQRLHTRNDL